MTHSDQTVEVFLSAYTDPDRAKAALERLEAMHRNEVIDLITRPLSSRTVTANYTLRRQPITPNGISARGPRLAPSSALFSRLRSSLPPSSGAKPAVSLATLPTRD